ncbi:PREDICTED: oxysterol-binding protein-related protein 2B isoform X3 [Brassica oleracea var. oleracea]|uniref:oxysterol-binding protein-related protein 2B isoform X3 n=1 Tax=Brassica oleracea var. oleracea TaxID=109376 RepID=UPI0006A73B9F|nr:PREDICTED: oxysterol-binding protein-related protein 2B isoform X3 [Brassica oleracea var. oleracea]
MPLTRSKSLPSTDAIAENGGSDRQNLSSGRSVAGILHKWTNYGKGWRSRWFLLRDGILSYSKIRRPENVNLLSPSDDVRLIGDNSTDRLSRMYSCSGRGRRKHHKTIGIVHLKQVSSYRESKSDNKKFYIFTANKTLHLRTDSRSDRAAWLQALASTRRILPLQSISGDFSFVSPTDLSISTERLKKRLRENGINENLVKECEEIVDSAFSEVQEQIKLLHEERTKLLDALKQLEMANLEAEASGIHESVYQLPNHNYSSLRSGKYSVQVLHLMCLRISPRKMSLPSMTLLSVLANLMLVPRTCISKDEQGFLIQQRKRKCFEDLEYSYLLDQAYEYGKSGNSLLRALYVAAFAVSGYASTEGRHCKPFNPLLGETYEADFPEKGIRFFSEKVSHHPTVIACHCEGKGWKFWGDTNLRSKFWGRSIQLEPVGVLTLEFDDGETFQWSKVTTTIYNILLGKLYCDHHGTMQIRGNRQYSSTLKFKEQSILDRNPHQVNGFVEDVTGKKAATIFGKWNDSLHYVSGDAFNKASASLLWKSTKPPPNVTRYNLTSFAITLNELTPGLEEKLPPTDSRLRPDQRHLEKGEYEKANEEKQRLERRQRMSRKIQESGWRPRWFEPQGESESYKYTGGYWEARNERRWDDCPNIFGEFTEEIADCA